MTLTKAFSGKFNKVFGSRGSLTLPRTGLIFYAKAPGLVDTIGSSGRTVYPLQYILMDGTGKFTHDSLSATCTITQPNGTTTLTAGSGEITGTVGTLWSFSVTYDDETISTYEFASLTGAASAIVFDTSGNGRHLVMSEFADFSAACSESMTIGSDYLNQYGFLQTTIGTDRSTDPLLVGGIFTVATGVVVADGIAVGNNAPSGDWPNHGLIWMDVDSVAGVTYTILIQVDRYTSGDIGVAFSGVYPTMIPVGFTGVFVCHCVCPTTGLDLVIQSLEGNATFSFSKISVFERFTNPLPMPTGAPFQVPGPSVVLWGDSILHNYGDVIRANNANITNQAVGGESSTQIRTRFFENGDYDSVCVFQAGYNDRAEIETVKTNNDAMIAKMTGDFLILSVFNDATETIGTQLHTDITNYNDYLANKYPHNYFDLRRYLIDQYDPEIPQDVIDYNNDIIPATLRLPDDSIHPNATANAILAEKVFSLLVDRGFYSYNANARQGRVKYNLATSGGLYSLPKAKELFDAAPDYYRSTGVPINMSEIALVVMSDWRYVFFGNRARVVYNSDQTDEATLNRINRYVKPIEFTNSLPDPLPIDAYNATETDGVWTMSAGSYVTLSGLAYTHEHSIFIIDVESISDNSTLILRIYDGLSVTDTQVTRIGRHIVEKTPAATSSGYFTLRNDSASEVDVKFTFTAYYRA